MFLCVLFGIGPSGRVDGEERAVGKGRLANLSDTLWNGDAG